MLSYYGLRILICLDKILLSVGALHFQNMKPDAFLDLRLLEKNSINFGNVELCCRQYSHRRVGSRSHGLAICLLTDLNTATVRRCEVPIEGLLLRRGCPDKT